MPGFSSKRVMLADPFVRRFDARIIARHAGVDHALEPGVRHRAVAAQPAVWGGAGLALAAGRNGVIEPAVVHLGGELGSVVLALQILAPRDEHQCLLECRVVFTAADGVQCVDEEARVRQDRAGCASRSRRLRSSCWRFRAPRLRPTAVL